VENLQHCCTTNITFTTGSEDVLKHGVDNQGTRSSLGRYVKRTKNSTWETWREKT